MNENIRRALVDSNPWWQGERKEGLKRRFLESEIESYIDKRQIISITGLRRCGKTSLFYRTINKLLDDYDSEQILYYSFDGFENVEIRDILSEYEEIQKRDFKKNKLFIFLDEVQKLEKWQDKIKRIYDSFENLKIFVSGSESLFFRKSKESLAGRIFEFHLNPLSFKEFLGFRGIDYEKPKLNKSRIQLAFDDYLFCGGFPEVAQSAEDEFIQRYLRESVIEKIIFKDIPDIFSIGNPSNLESIFNLFIDRPAQITSIQSISSDLGMTRQTISKYLKYLEMSYLLKKSYNYSDSGRKRERKLKKYSLTIPALSLLRKDNRETRSKAFEALLTVQTDADYFWRSNRKEVDLVVEQEGELIPIEVKYRNKKKYSGLLDFMNKQDIGTGFVITRNLESTETKDGKQVLFVPAWKFLIKNLENGKIVNSD